MVFRNTDIDVAVLWQLLWTCFLM